MYIFATTAFFAVNDERLGSSFRFWANVIVWCVAFFVTWLNEPMLVDWAISAVIMALAFVVGLVLAMWRDHKRK